MTQRCEDLQRRGEIKALAWVRIEPMDEGIQFALRIPRQVRSGASIDAAIRQCYRSRRVARAIRVGKVDADGKALNQPLMFRHLFASIIGQCLAERGRYMWECSRETIAGAHRICSLHGSRRRRHRLNSLCLERACCKRGALRARESPKCALWLRGKDDGTQHEGMT